MSFDLQSLVEQLSFSSSKANTGYAIREYYNGFSKRGRNGNRDKLEGAWDQGSLTSEGTLEITYFTH